VAKATERTVPATELRYGELDRDRVVAAALALAEHHSLQKVTMRALAAHLGTSPAALYYHVRNRGELLDVTTESVLAGIRVPPPELPWDAQLRELFVDARRAMLPVRGIATTLQSRPVAPSGRRLRDAATAILRAAGFSPASSRAANMALSTFLLGAVALEQTIAVEVAAATAPRTGGTRRPSSLFRNRDFTAGLDLIIGGLKHQQEMT
jgi:AcrR family transcriptional regulator